MAAESANMWQDVLPSVYKLILRNTDKIVDDTSLEKLLDLMEHVNEDAERRKMLLDPATVMFLNDIQHSRSAVAVGFGLRLSAIISSTAEGFNTLCNPEGGCSVLSSNNLFCEVLQEENGLWFDVVVRDSYFKGAIGILGVSEGLLWTQKSGCLEQALKCLVDSSIFVAANARKFISKYLVTLFISNQQETPEHKQTSSTGQHLKSTENQHCHSTKNTAGSLREDDLTCVRCIVHHLQYLMKVPPSGLERKMPCQVSIAQLLLSLAEENPLVAQDILQENSIFYSCLELLHCTNKDECGKVVDVITTFMNNTSKWNINWELLLNSHGQDTLYTLLEFCLVLCQRSLVFLAFQFTQGLFAIPCPCELKDAWLCSIFTLITFPVHGSLHEEIVMQNVKVSDCHLKETAKNLLSTIFSRDNAYQVMDSALGESAKKFLSSPSVSHSLLVTTDIIKDLKKVPNVGQFENFIRSWAADVLALLTQQSECPHSGNHMLRQCIKALTVCISHGFVHNSDGNVSPNVRKIFSLFLKLSNERSDGQILSGCFEGIKTLLVCADQMCLTCFLQESVDNVTLGDVLRQHCCHSCWDVKDSVLGFLRHILVTFAGEKHKLFQRFLIKHQLLNLVWTLTNDIESYVRASAIQLVGVISTNADLWKDFCEAIQLSPEDILRHILESFTNDEAAFPRRAIVTLLAFWMKSEHELVSFVLRQQPDHGRSTRHRGTKLEPCVADVLEKARQDFDWEVKLCALNFWEDMMERCDRETREQDGIGEDGEESTVVSKRRALVDALSCIGFDKVVLGALVDCDKPVRRRGFELLHSWRERVVEIDELIIAQDGDNEMVEPVDSIEELEDYLSKIDGEKNYTLAKVSPAIDVSRLTSGCDDDSLFSDPLLFLKDILLAATNSENNLLDCY